MRLSSRSSSREAGREEEFIELTVHDDEDFLSFRRGVLVKTGEHSTVSGEWESMEALVRHDPQSNRSAGFRDALRPWN